MAPARRCYLPMTAEQLRTLHRERRLTEQVPVFTAPSDEGASAAQVEEAEHAALQAAARHALSRGGPVIVAALDLEPSSWESLPGAGGQGPAPEGRSVGALTLPRVASLHVGDDVLGQGIPSTLPGEDLELSWYDTTEVEHLVHLL